MRDRASGVHPDILEHLPPPKNQSLPTVLLCALTSDFTGVNQLFSWIFVSDFISYIKK